MSCTLLVRCIFVDIYSVQANRIILDHEFRNVVIIIKLLLIPHVNNAYSYKQAEYFQLYNKSYTQYQPYKHIKWLLVFPLASFTPPFAPLPLRHSVSHHYSPSRQHSNLNLPPPPPPK